MCQLQTLVELVKYTTCAKNDIKKCTFIALIPWKEYNQPKLSKASKVVPCMVLITKKGGALTKGEFMESLSLPPILYMFVAL